MTDDRTTTPAAEQQDARDLLGVTTNLDVGGGQRAGWTTDCLGLPRPGSVRFADDRCVRQDVVALLPKLGEQLVDVSTFGQQAVDVDP